MELRFAPLFSGSSGNSIYVGTDRTNLLIDAGVSGSRVLDELKTVGVNPSDLDGILVTHEHSDHIKGVGVLARKLRALDACVSASARSPRDLARIEAAGMTALRTGELAGKLSGFPLIFNTVPAPVFGPAELSGLFPGALLIDLASLPGGVAPDAALPDGCRVLHALSLPGRVAPRTAARAIHDTVLNILREEAVL